VSLKNGRSICIEIEIEATRLGGKVLKWLWCVTEHKGAGATPMESLWQARLWQIPCPGLVWFDRIHAEPIFLARNPAFGLWIFPCTAPTRSSFSWIEIRHNALQYSCAPRNSPFRAFTTPNSAYLENQDRWRCPILESDTILPGLHDFLAQVKWVCRGVFTPLESPKSQQSERDLLGSNTSGLIKAVTGKGDSSFGYFRTVDKRHTAT